MWVIVKTALRERMRKKELYIVVAIGLLLLLLCSSDATTISVGGEPVTSFDNLFPILHTILNAVGCLLAAVLSVRTIPDEYVRKTSHLVWVRGISQEKYHAGLALANVLGSVIAMGVLYAALAIYVIANGRMDYLARMIPAFVMVCLNPALVCLFVSVLGIKLPVLAAGTLGVGFLCVGVLHGILNLYRNIAGGVANDLLSGILFVLPDLHGIQKQAQCILAGQPADIHLILTGLLALYVISLGLFVLKRKEV